MITEPPDSNIPEKISLLREYLHLSLSAFGSRIDLSPTHISRLENGVTVPSQKILDRICDVYNVDPEYFSDDIVASAVGDVEPWVRKKSVDPDDYDGLTIPERIRMLRERKGWTQHQLAVKAEVSNILLQIFRDFMKVMLFFLNGLVMRSRFSQECILFVIQNSS